MNRAELRRADRNQKKQTKTFTLTQAQIDRIKIEATKKAVNEAVNRAFFLMLTIPLEVLINEDYWFKSAPKKIPKFTEDVIKLYRAFEAGDITIGQMAYDLKRFTGIEVDPVHGVRV